MLNDQVIGLLQNNAGNPDIVRRIAEENQLSQAEIAQALRIPEGSAARYMPGMNPEQGMEAGSIDGGMVKPAPMATKPGMQPPQIPMADGAPAAGGGVASVSAPSLAGSAANAMTAGSAGGGMASGQALRPGAIGGDLANPVYGGEPGSERFTPPSSPGIPSSPMGQRQIIGQPGMRQQEPATGIPAAPAIGSRPADMGMIKPDMGTTKPAKMPADMKPQGLEQLRGRLRRPDMTEGEEAFVSAFNRLRGVRE